MSNENFIHTFYIDGKICDDLIDYFHANEEYKMTSQQIGYPPDVKESTDVICFPNTSNENLHAYFEAMMNGLHSYGEKYGDHGGFPRGLVIDEHLTIQHYAPNQGYKQWHTERNNHQDKQRALVFMTYLNDFNGFGTEFRYYPDFKVKAKKGLTVIWPTDFTHTHRSIIDEHDKYIATGWFNYSNVNMVSRAYENYISGMNSTIETLEKLVNGEKVEVPGMPSEEGEHSS